MHKELVDKCRKIIECDAARISQPLEDGNMFLVIGFNRNTKDDPGQWRDQNGKDIDFDYVAERTVATGRTEEELLDSAREYNRLLGMTMKEYLEEVWGCELPDIPNYEMYEINKSET